MYEVRSVRQRDPNLRLRWFTTESCNFDLYVWEHPDSGSIVHFQFYFDRNMEEKLVEWKSASFRYAVVDGGGNGFFKSSPLLCRIDHIDLHSVLHLFTAIAEDIDEYIREFIVDCFREKLRQAG